MKTREDKIRNFAKWALIFLILFSTFLLAPYLKYDAADSARKKLQAEIDDKSPKLEGFIHRIAGFDEAGTSNSLMFLDVNVSNPGGSASYADEYGLKVGLSTNSSAVAEEIKFSDEYKFTFIRKEKPWLLDLKRHQLIGEKTIKAIPAGEHERGWLAYRLHGVKIGQYNQTNIVFSFADINRKGIRATNGFWKGKSIILTNLDDFEMEIPGAENIFFPITNTYVNTTTNWLPPELSPDCTNVTLFFGTTPFNFSRMMAEISTESTGTKFALKDLPDYMLKDVDKIPNHSPRDKFMWIRWSTAQQVYGDTTVNLPLLPFIVSNRFYVEVQMPFLIEKRKVMMSEEFNSALDKIPQWDWNYSTNYGENRGVFICELVNEFTNPVLQVFYLRPDTILVNGVFVVDTNKVLWAFNCPPQLYTMGQYKFINTTNRQEITDISNFLGTNTIGEIITNMLFNLKLPGQRAIFKYPSGMHLGEFEDWFSGTNKSDTKTFEKP